LAGLGAVEASYDIIHSRAGSVFVASESGLHFRRISKLRKFFEDSRADGVVRSAPGGMRNSVAYQLVENYASTSRGEL
jgi:hypothetical protein